MYFTYCLHLIYYHRRILSFKQFNSTPNNIIPNISFPKYLCQFILYDYLLNQLSLNSNTNFY